MDITTYTVEESVFVTRLIFERVLEPIGERDETSIAVC